LKSFAGQVVVNFTANFGALRILRDRLAKNGNFLTRVWVLLFVFVASGAAARANTSNPPARSIGPGSQFAISDFDGDRRPDIASIQPAPNGPGRTNYWIQVQLSETGRQFIRLAGPAGGLQIEARDVNGDRAVDLVVTTAWFRQPVAIFLNDGHGSFTQTEPDSFPGAFNESGESFSAVVQLSMDTVGVPPQSGAGLCSEAGAPARLQSNVGSIPPPSSGFVHSSFLISHAGRAPPSLVSLC
jgi:hypothetical protein